MQAKALDIENDLRGTLRDFGLKVGMVGTVKSTCLTRNGHTPISALAMYELKR